MPNRDYHAERKSYEMGALDDSFIAQSPLLLLQTWFDDAFNHKIDEPTAMNLATVDAQGRPHSRIVLLKQLDQAGLVFYTNYASDKGEELAHNPFAALNFFWPQLERQIRIEGKVTKISAEASDRYFQSRPLDSQLGALVSEQSQVLANREAIEQKMAELKHRYANQAPTRPAHWGGYCLAPERIEFWQGRPNRLHDRINFTRHTDGSWHGQRLSP
ncbi:pyridoxamine 5'-phosphate oxidase [Thiomicrospira aerophila AL3]|uniref:Pyridoxine/pyridoxamine 5'-phosphate oxidase n=1 Tax=Thiomicrospira aerophila AL3 TaxID=717772 RepID=W0DVH8_9GAMM|nr:pyridoxamine 5'-phosphate oxidase [Thiomicrospira aerophila]AHF00871.1 pyridoxamine 5'-phosphate oxidase [Thiomicrospira aerophila AL3]